MNRNFLLALIGSIGLTCAIAIMAVGKPWEPVGPGIPLFLGILFSLLSLQARKQNDDR